MAHSHLARPAVLVIEPAPDLVFVSSWLGVLLLLVGLSFKCVEAETCMRLADLGALDLQLLLLLLFICELPIVLIFLPTYWTVVVELSSPNGEDKNKDECEVSTTSGSILITIDSPRYYSVLRL